MARTFACLRIAEAIAGPVARLTTGSGGLTLSRAGFAPAGRQTKFHEGIVSSLPFDQHCLVALNFLSAHPYRDKSVPSTHNDRRGMPVVSDAQTLERSCSVKMA